MFCKYCGKQIPDNVKFCVYCGREMDVSSEQEIPTYHDHMENKGVNAREDSIQNNYVDSFDHEKMEGNWKQNLIPLAIIMSVLAVIIGFSAYLFFWKS